MKSIIIKILAIAFLLHCQGCQTTHHSETSSVKEIALPSKGISHQHELTRTADNQLLASWVEAEDSNHTVSFAIYHDDNWQPVRTVTSVNSKLAASPIVFGTSDGSFSAAWMQSVKNDKDPYAADIYWVRSNDHGQTWTAPIKPYSKQARIYDAQMSFAPMPKDKLALVWTDSRFVNHDETETSTNKTSRYQIMAAILDKDGNIGKEITLDNDVCSCCRVYTDADGDKLMTVYRDHLKGEIRDISAVSWQEGHISQQFPVHNDHWVINGCPSNGPSVDLTNDNGVIAWFNSGDGKGKFWLGFTSENTIKSSVVVDDHAVGFGKAKLLGDGSALVVWRSNAGPEEELVLAQVTPKGEINHRKVIHHGNFPRWPSNYIGLETIGNQAYIAWTDPVKKQVRLVEVTL
jgi:hypothetical protein